MEKQFARLTHIEHNQPITQDADYEFLHHLQQALLTALREQGRLSPIMYRHATEKLDQQRRERARRLLDAEDTQ
jgi:hypothetical protein